MITTTYEEMLEKTGFLFWKTVGFSMRPLIREGKDTVIIKKRPEGRCKKYDTVLFTRPGVEGRGKYILHRILRVNPDGTYWIVGDNCTSGEIVREENVLGVLIAVNRKGRKVEVTSRKYQLYVRLWCAPYRMRFFLLRNKWFLLALWRLPRRIGGKILRKLGLRK